MSSDDEFIGSAIDPRRASMASQRRTKVSSAVDSRQFNDTTASDDILVEENEPRSDVNGHTTTTANDIANTDENVRQVLYSDVRSPYILRS
jgi:hypothetical protein